MEEERTALNLNDIFDSVQHPNILSGMNNVPNLCQYVCIEGPMIMAFDELIKTRIGIDEKIPQHISGELAKHLLTHDTAQCMYFP